MRFLPKTMTGFFSCSVSRISLRFREFSVQTHNGSNMAQIWPGLGTEEREEKSDKSEVQR